MKKKNFTTYVVVGTLCLILMIFIGGAYLKGDMAEGVNVAYVMFAMAILSIYGGALIMRGLDIHKALLFSRVSGILGLVETETGYAFKLDLHDTLPEIAREDHIILAVGFNEDIFKEEEDDGDSGQGSEV